MASRAAAIFVSFDTFFFFFWVGKYCPFLKEKKQKNIFVKMKKKLSVGII